MSSMPIRRRSYLLWAMAAYLVKNPRGVFHVQERGVAAGERIGRGIPA